MTKREMFVTIKTILSDNKDVVTFCDHEIELLDSKRGSNKPSAKQIENKELKKAIYEFLVNADDGKTISNICDECEAVAGLKNQRVSALVKQLKDENKVTRKEIKRVAYFTAV